MLKRRYYCKNQYQQQQRVVEAVILLVLLTAIIMLMMMMTTLYSKRIWVHGATTTTTRTGYLSASSSSFSISMTRRRRFLSPSSSAFLSFPPPPPPPPRHQSSCGGCELTRTISLSSALFGASAGRRSSSSTRNSSSSEPKKAKMKMPKSSIAPPQPSPRSPKMRIPTGTSTASITQSSLILPQQPPSTMATKNNKKQQQKQTRRYYYRASSLSNTSSASAKAPLSAPTSIMEPLTIKNHDFSNNYNNSTNSRSNNSRMMADPQKTYILRVKGMSSSKKTGMSIGSTGIGFVLFEANDDDEIHNASTTLTLEDCWIACSLYLEGSRSVFEAAYTAIVMGLQHATVQTNVRNIIVQIDHDVIYKQLVGEFKVQRDSLVQMYWKIMQIKECHFHNNNNNSNSNSNNTNTNGDDLSSSSSFTIQYISPLQNELAKNLSTRALGTQTSQTLLWSQPDNETFNSSDANSDPMIPFLITKYSTTTTMPPQEQTIAAAAAQQTRAAHTLTTLEGPIDEDEEEPINTTTRIREAEVNIIYSDEEQHDVDIGATSTIDIDPSKTYLLQFDGGARGNPGIAGGGMVLYDHADDGDEQQPTREVWCGWEFFGTNLSNNQAEYQSLIRGLEAARALGIRLLIVQGDSELIVKQLNGIYAVKNANLRLYFAQVQALAAQFVTFHIGHIRRAQNARADALANHAMDHQGSHHGLLPSSSFHQTVEVPPVMLKQRQVHSTTRNENNTSVSIQKRQLSSFAALPLVENNSSSSSDENDDDRDAMSSTTILLDQLMKPSVRYVFDTDLALSYDESGLYNGQQSSNDDDNSAARQEETSQLPTESIIDSNDTRDDTLLSKVLPPPNDTNAYDNENCNVTETKPPPPLDTPSSNVVNRIRVADEMSSSAPGTVATAQLDIDSSKKYRLQFDGGSRGNPGLAGAGMVLYDDDTGKEVWCACKYLGKGMTNNQAEYSGLLLGLEAALSLDIHQLTVEGDSELIVRQINGIYKVRSAKLRVYYEAIQERIQKLDSFQIQQIPRARNARADELANLAMDTFQSSDGLEDPL